MYKQVYKCPNHTTNLNSMRLNNRWCDLTIKVGGTEFRAHKNILAANLQYFERMLLGDSFKESKEGVITMESVNPKDLEAFITYAYTGEISVTDANALDLLETANYLGEEGIEGACIKFLEEHLKLEESLRAYGIAKAIDNVSLKNAAKSRIVSNFEFVSQSSEYLHLDFTKLPDILSDGKARLVESQETLFEGVMRWILHDAKERRFSFNELLSFIDVSKLPTDYFVEYVGSMAERSADDSAVIVKDLMSWFYTASKIESITKLRVAHSEQAIAILGRVGGKLSVQYYNFGEKKWSRPQSIATSDETVSSCAVLDDKLYFISRKSGSCSLNMFDPSSKLNTVLHITSSKIVGWPAVCACSRFIYLCGGRKADCSESSRVLRYDPRTNSLESLPAMPTRRQNSAAIFYRGCLHVVGGSVGYCAYATNKVEKYDPDAKKWMEFPSTCKQLYMHEVAVLDGKMYACEKRNSVEVYDPAKNSWQPVASMIKDRSDFTLVAHEGKLLAIGGLDAEQSVEVYDPNLNRWRMDAEMSSGLKLIENMGGLISSNCLTDAE